MALECSIARERNRFIKKVKRNPIFLLQHLPSIASILLQRYQRKRNRKIFPHWLSARLEKINVIDCQDTWRRIPERKLYLSNQQKIEHAFSHDEHQQMSDTTISDSEDYFAQHRFSELLKFSTKSQHTLPDSVYQWIKKPPPKSDLAWETYSTCERVANLLTWISFVPMAERDALPQNIVLFLTESMYWISDHLEYYRDNTNNHILNNARALIMCGVALNHTQAVTNGFEIFTRMLPLLIQRQGALRERSTHYQLIILNWLLDASYFMQSNSQLNLLSSSYFEETITRMRDVAAHFCDEAGYLQAFIGDISPDASPQLTVERLRDCYPEFWPKQKTKNDQGQQHLKPIQKSARMLVAQYDDYYFLNKNQHKIILNCPQDHFPRQHPSHGHNDLTSFVWCYGDQVILIDSGRARYCKDKVSSQQKSAYGHNIAFVDHCPPCSESFVIQGNWWPQPYADADFSVIHHHQQDRLSISHNGFKRATRVKTHIRTLFIDDADQLNIEDYFQGNDKSKGKVEIQIFWQLHPALNRTDNKNNVFSNNKMIVEYETDAEDITITREGFCSSQYGEVKQHQVLILKWKVELPFSAKITFKVKQICAA